MRHPLLKRIKNHRSNAFRIRSQFPIPKTHHSDAGLLEKLGALFILVLLGRKPVLSAIQFNGQLGLGAKEIQNIRSNWLLPSELVTRKSSITDPPPNRFLCPSLIAY